MDDDYDHSYNEMNQSIDEYNDLWAQSTTAFRESHLIADQQIRKILLWECERALGVRNFCYRSRRAGSALYDAVYEACSYEARRRFHGENFHLIQNYGYFAFDGFSYLVRNTLIVSVYSDIIIRYSPNYYRSIDEMDILFKVERTNIGQHLCWNSHYDIVHFQR